MKKCAIYARVSTTIMQDYERQISELTIIAKKDGYDESNIDIYGEKLSGYKASVDRPQLSSLLSKLKDRSDYYKCVYVSEISRIGRNPKEIRNIIDMITEHKCNVYIQNHQLFVLDKDGKTHMMANILLTIISELANLEAENLKTRSKSGFLEKASWGRWSGGSNLPYGYYRAADKMLMVEETEEAGIIKEIFSLYKTGTGTKMIANTLNERKILTRKNKTHADRPINFKTVTKDGSAVIWSEKQIHDILTNTLYMGDRKFKGQIFKAPPIVSKELFEECNALLKTKTTRNSVTKYNYLLKDIIKCGVCGRNYYGVYKAGVGGQKSYICSSWFTSKKGCGNSGINIYLIESTIYHQVIKTNLVLKYLNNTQGLKKEIEDKIIQLEQSLKLESAALKLKTFQADNLYKLYLSDGKLAQYEKRNTLIENETLLVSEKIKLIEIQLRENKDAIVNLSNNSVTKRLLREAKKDRTQLQAIYKQLFPKIIVNTIDKKNCLIAVSIGVNGTILREPLKMILNTGGTNRKLSKVYQYAEVSFMNEYEPYYKDNIMIGITANEIYNEISPYLKWITIKEQDMVRLNTIQ